VIIQFEKIHKDGMFGDGNGFHWAWLLLPALIDKRSLPPLGIVRIVS